MVDASPVVAAPPVEKCHDGDGTGGVELTEGDSPPFFFPELTDEKFALLTSSVLMSPDIHQSNRVYDFVVRVLTLAIEESDPEEGMYEELLKQRPWLAEEVRIPNLPAFMKRNRRGYTRESYLSLIRKREKYRYSQMFPY